MYIFISIYVCILRVDPPLQRVVSTSIHTFVYVNMCVCVCVCMHNVRVLAGWIQPDCKDFKAKYGIGALQVYM